MHSACHISIHLLSHVAGISDYDYLGREGDQLHLLQQILACKEIIDLFVQALYIYTRIQVYFEEKYFFPF